MLTIACCLKSGGIYNWEYVNRLYKGVEENLNYSYKFVILTDMGEFTYKEAQSLPSNVEVHCLQMDLPKYWSKIELFQLKGEVIYFDLDTIILKPINNLVYRILCDIGESVSNSFYMLKAFRIGEVWASGIMAWTGDWSWLMDEFDRSSDIPGGRRSWEQRYIKEKLKSRGVKIGAVNDYLPKIYSYKHHCRNGIPNGAGIVCFHGKPNPQEVGWLIGEKGKKQYV